MKILYSNTFFNERKIDTLAPRDKMNNGQNIYDKRTLTQSLCSNQPRMVSLIQFSRSVMSGSLQPHESHAARQASLSITNFRSLLKLMPIESVMTCNHLILCRPPLLLSPIPPSIRVFQRVNSSHEVAKVLEFQLQHQSFQ